jgi:hypothetical protein
MKYRKRNFSEQYQSKGTHGISRLIGNTLATVLVGMRPSLVISYVFALAIMLLWFLLEKLGMGHVAAMSTILGQVGLLVLVILWVDVPPEGFSEFFERLAERARKAMRERTHTSLGKLLRNAAETLDDLAGFARKAEADKNRKKLTKLNRKSNKAMEKGRKANAKLLAKLAEQGQKNKKKLGDLAKKSWVVNNTLEELSQRDWEAERDKLHRRYDERVQKTNQFLTIAKENIRNAETMDDLMAAMYAEDDLEQLVVDYERWFALALEEHDKRKPGRQQGNNEVG